MKTLKHFLPNGQLHLLVKTDDNYKILSGRFFYNNRELPVRTIGVWKEDFIMEGGPRYMLGLSIDSAKIDKEVLLDFPSMAFWPLGYLGMSELYVNAEISLKAKPNHPDDIERFTTLEKFND